MPRHKLPVASRTGRLVTVLTTLFGFLAGLTLVVTHTAGQGGATTVAHQSSLSTRSFRYCVSHGQHHHGNPSPQLAVWCRHHVSPSSAASAAASSAPSSSSPTPSTSSAGSGSPSPTPSPTSTQVLPPGSVQPDGPAGNWKLVWSDEFNGTSIDQSKWHVDNGVNRNQTPMYASNVSESGGALNLAVQSASSGANVVSASQFGDIPAPANSYRMKVGDVVESRILFPTVNGKVANWPSLWFFGDPNAPAPGEIDLFEGLGGGATCNYHPPSGPATITSIPGWTAGWHTYTLVRHATSFDAYLDGHKFLTQPTNDSGSPMSVIIVNGAGQYGGPVSAATVQVDYVRAWSPA